MAKIIGGTTATNMLLPDWNQTDPTKSDFIRNKPDLGRYATLDTIGDIEAALDRIIAIQESLIGGDS